MTEDLAVMRLLDEQYTKTPFYGVERMTAHLHRKGIIIGHNHVRRLLRLMGLEAIYPKPRLSMPDLQHRIYPYLLRDIRVYKPNQVWAADITYIRLLEGFVYLVAIMDWFSRYVISWELSITLDTQFCIDALQRALLISKPDIFNTDQGSQFTSIAFTDVLKDAGVQISMDSKGRWMDNVMIERLWRSMKYECVYLHAFETGSEAKAGIGKWITFYNEPSPPSSLDDKTPDEAYCRNSGAGSPVPVDPQAAARPPEPYTLNSFLTCPNLGDHP